MTVAVAVLAVAGVLVYVRGSSTSQTTSKDPKARVESALFATNSAVTADLTLDIKANVDGVSFGVTATGSVDFSTKAASLNMDAFGATLALIETAGSLYAKLGKLVSTQFPGKSWVRIPASTLTGERESRLLLTSDPEAMMSSLLKVGATVTPIGVATIDGSQDQGYRIHLTIAGLESHASELPPSIRSLLTTATTAPKTAAVSMTMYVDPAGQLQAAYVVVALQATGHPDSVSIDLTMSHFGTASVPAAPPATQTVTYRELKGPVGSGTFPFTLPGGVQTT